VIDALLLLIGRIKKREKEVDRGFFTMARDWTPLAGCSGWDFHGC
jgi:hypothetical protein